MLAYRGDTPICMKPRVLPSAAVVFAVALLLRLIHLWQLRRSPFFEVLMGDAQSYHEWARRIAGGEWVGRDVFYQAPLYPYFLGVIYAAIGESPIAVRLVQAIVGSASCALLALAGARFFSSPRFSPADAPRPPKEVRPAKRRNQAHRTAQPHPANQPSPPHQPYLHGPRYSAAGFVAGAVLALYAPAIFFDGLIQKSVLDVFFISLALWLIARILTVRLKPDAPCDTAAERRRSARRTKGKKSLGDHAFGRTFGGCRSASQSARLSLTRENALVFIAVICRVGRAANGVRWIADAASRAAVRAAALFLAGLVDRPGARSRRATRYVGGGFYMTTSQFGPNFYIGNNPNADGTYHVAALRPRRAGVRAAGRHRARRARARPARSRRRTSRATGPTRRSTSSRRNRARG